MVDLSYLRRKNTRKAVTLVGVISAACAVVIGAVSALGQFASPLTIKLNNSNSSLGLKKLNSDETISTFLVADNVPGYSENSYNYIFDGYSDPTKVAEMDAKIDNELSTSKLTGDKSSTLYYKYSFYVTNIGNTVADYDVSLTIDRMSSNTKDFDLSDILRVRLYENADLSQHNSKTYAKPEIVQAEGGGLDRKQVHISTDDSPLAESFVDNSTLVKSTFKGLQPKQTCRYTFMLWLEGFDKDSIGKLPPTNSSLALGVDIQGHEGSTEQ